MNKYQIKFNGSWIGSVWSLANITYYNDSNEVVTDTALATQYSLVEGVTMIGDSCFSGCTNLVSITISDVITSIGVSAFDGCTGLTDIYITPAESLEDMKTIMGVNNSSVVSLMKADPNMTPTYFLEDKNGRFIPVAHSDSTFVNELNSEGKSKTLTEKLAEIIASSGVTVEMLTAAVNEHNNSNTAHASIRAILDTCVGLPTYDSTTYVMTFTTKAGATFEINLPIEQLGLSYNATDNAIEFENADGSITSIPVIDFIEIYTGSIGEQIQITIGSGNVIQATILENSITKGQLSNEVQTLLDDIANKLNATDISDWAKEPTKPTYTAAEVDAYSKSEIDAKLLETISVGEKVGEVSITL